MSPHKGYMNIAIAAMLFVAAFAGVVFIADEDVAAAEESQSQAQEYTVTYSYDGFVFSEKTSDGQLTVRGFNTASEGEEGVESKYSAALPNAKAPEGYAFAYWVAGSATYNAGVSAQFAGDVTLTPVFKADRAIVKLVYGDVVKEFFPPTSAAAAAAAAKDSGSEDSYLQKYPISYSSAKGLDVKDTKLAEFAEAIGATYTTTTNDKSKTVAIDKLVLDGFEFKGFVDKDGKSVGFDGLIATATATATREGIDKVWTLGSAEPAVYTAVFEPIYNITFIVDGTKTFECKSNAFVQPIDPVKANYTFIGWAVDGKVVSEVKAGVITIPVDYKFEADTVFTAVFEPVQLTITLMIGELETTQPALYGQTITAPGLPAGYECWATKVVEMKDGAEVITYTPFDFSKPITESVTLYAQLAEKVYTITFVSEGAVIGGPYDVSKKFTIPEDPVVEGKKFVGWFVDDYKVLDVMAYIADHPEQDIVLTASFTEADAPAGPDFIDTNEGKCVLILIGVALVAFAYAVYTNMFGLKDKLTSVKLVRVKKE